MIKHVALIMDGNRRWAKSRGLFAWQGHEQGAKNVEMVLQYCIEKNIEYVSLYTLSIENLNRSEIELSYLFSLIADVKNRISEFVKNSIQVRFVGDRSLVPAHVLSDIIAIEQATIMSSKLVCNFLFCYGSGQEIVAAAQKYVNDDSRSNVLTVSEFKKYLWLGDIPDPDLIVRTGGVQRLSNFLLLQSAYSEIRFLSCFWPDLSKQELDAVVMQAVAAQKNFGK